MRWVLRTLAPPAIAANWVPLRGTESADTNVFKAPTSKEALVSGSRLENPSKVGNRGAPQRVQPQQQRPGANRLSQTWTLGTQYFFNKNTRVTLNHEWRDQKVPRLGAITNAAQRATHPVVPSIVWEGCTNLPDSSNLEQIGQAFQFPG